MNVRTIPKDGLAGLRENWRQDATAGFLVFLLALPLSLGIAKASEFPTAMGVLTAMIGGLLVTALAGSRVTIKGPAAGLITICAGAVTELGGGAQGWHLTLGVIFVAAVIQVILGLLKFGSLADFFPQSAVHGMLAAIGLIIFSKQIHVLLGIDPASLSGLTPFEMYRMIPQSIMNEDLRVTLVGIISLVIIFGVPMLKGGIIRKIPAPMLVIVVTVPLALIMDFRHTEPAFDLVSIGDFWSSVGYNADFSMVGSLIFWKYVFMFLFVNSLESLLTVKAIDGLDPWRRVSDPNKDLVAVGLGNGLCGLLGGLPMISEVARSSANISFGGRTRWANFFHGLFLLLAMLLFIPLIEMIPNTALAALLIAVAYRLASPNEFFKTYRIGSEQLVIFLVTIFVTLSTDLLIGVGAGILTKFVFHILNGAPIRSLFKAQYDLEEHNGNYTITVRDSAIFSNLIAYRRLLKTIKPGRKVVFNFSQALIVDHSFMEQLQHFEEEYYRGGGLVAITGFESFKSFSKHPLAARKFSPDQLNRFEIQLNPRQVALRKFADVNEYDFNPQQSRTKGKYKDFPVQQGSQVRFEENALSKYKDFGKIEITDMTIVEESLQESRELKITVMHLTELNLPIPDFALEPENLGTRFSELVVGKDLDFGSFPVFSQKYYLRGEEQEVREFFDESLVRFFESQPGFHIECHSRRLLIYKQRKLLDPSEFGSLESFADDLIAVISKRVKSGN